MSTPPAAGPPTALGAGDTKVRRTVLPMTMVLAAITYLDRAANFLLGAAWGTCLDIGGRRAGALSGAMNTSGQVGAILSPIIIALVVQRSGIPAAPLFVTGILFLLGAVAWLWIDPTKPVSD